MSRLNYHHLYLFYVIAMEGSIKRASEKVHLTQPTLSDQLRSLEDYFGARLFERNGRQLSLNKAGKTALEYAQKIFYLGNELQLKLKGQLHGPQNIYTVGLTHYMSHYFSYDSFFPLFQEKEMTTKFSVGEKTYLLADLELGDLDLLISTNKEGISSNMVARRIGMNKTFAVAHKKFLKKTKKTAFPELLSDIPYFHYSPDSELYFDIEVFFRTHGISPQIIGQGDDLDLFQLVTEKGIGFTIIPDATLGRFKGNKDLTILGELKDLQSSVWAIMRKDAEGGLVDFITQLGNSLNVEGD